MSAFYQGNVLARLALATGAALVNFLQNGVGAVIRSLQDILYDRVSIFDFMTAAERADVRNGTLALNVSASVQKAFTYSESSGKSLRAPAGKYNVAGLTWNPTSTHAQLIGEGSGNTFFINKIDTTPPLTIGNAGTPNQFRIAGISFSGNGSVTSWGSGNGAAGNNLVGTRPTTSAALTLINPVHCQFDDVYFMNAIWGLDLQGAVVATFNNCYAYYNDAIGFRIYKSAGSSWPNLVTLNDCHAIENGQVGVYFDQGRNLRINGGDIEGNGKNTTVATTIGCGLYIGSQTGIENGATAGPNGGAFHTLAVAVRGCWFEQNGNNDGAGHPSSTDMAHVLLRHGFLDMEACTMTNCTAGRYFGIDGGQYHLSKIALESALTVSTNYIDERGTGNANLVGRNFVSQCFTNTTGVLAALTSANCVIDKTKTFFDYKLNEGNFCQSGSGNTAAGVLNVTFPLAFAAVPNVMAQVYTNDNTGTTYSAEVFNLTATGCSIRAKQNAAGTVTQPVLLVMWLANGKL